MLEKFAKTYPAPAKINLFLHIIGQKPDGYHLLQSVFAIINICDQVYIKPRDDGKIIRLDYQDKNINFQIPEKNDLAIRSAYALKNYCCQNSHKLSISSPENLGAEIRVEKNIPIGAGLGGGSSDAATVLLALNKIWQLNLSREILISIAINLGADVPFFIFGQSAFVEGIGEKLTAINLPSASYALMVPPIHIPTAKIFSAKNLNRKSPAVDINDINNELQKSQCFSESCWHNDLQAVAEEFFPKMIKHRQSFAQSLNLNCDKNIKMSGSGSAYFYKFLDNFQNAPKFLELMHYNSHPFLEEKVFWKFTQILPKHQLYDFC